MAGNFKHNVFLSHNSKDKSAVRELKRSHKGLAVWLDEGPLQPEILWQRR